MRKTRPKMYRTHQIKVKTTSYGPQKEVKLNSGTVKVPTSVPSGHPECMLRNPDLPLLSACNSCSPIWTCHPSVYLLVSSSGQILPAFSSAALSQICDVYGHSACSASPLQLIHTSYQHLPVLLVSQPGLLRPLCYKLHL